MSYPSYDQFRLIFVLEMINCDDCVVIYYSRSESNHTGVETNFFCYLQKIASAMISSLLNASCYSQNEKYVFSFVLLSISLIYHKMKTSRSRFTEKFCHHFLHIIVIP